MRISLFVMPVSLTAAGLQPAAVVGVVPPVLVPPVVVVPPPVVVSPVAPAWRLVFFLLSLPDRAATTPTPMSAIVRLSARPLAATLFAAIQPTHPRCATMRNLTGEPEECSRGVGARLDLVPGHGGRGHLRPRRL